MLTIRKISIGLAGIAIGVLVCAAIYYTAYARGLRAGLSVAEINSYSAMLTDLAGSKHLRRDKDKEIILAAVSANIMLYLTTVDMNTMASKPLANLSSRMKGNPTIFDLSLVERDANKKLSSFLDVCRNAINNDNLYKKYCELPISEYQTKR